MSIPVIAFFNNKSGVGKTSMVYHLAWMLSDLGCRVVAADLDPQGNLTAAFLDEDRLEELTSGDEHDLTIFGAIQPLKDGTGDVSAPHVESINDRLGLIPGDMALSTFEDDLSEVWPKCLSGDPRAFRITSAFWRAIQMGAAARQADVVLIDLGPNLGAINRVGLIASDFVVIPLGPDLFSLQGLMNLGPALEKWREGWKRRLVETPPKDVELPAGGIKPVGYIVLRHSIRLDRPVQAFDRWIARIPLTYAKSVLRHSPGGTVTTETDPNCIAKLKDYRSLMPLAQEARKPIFFLKPADGALGAHTSAVSDAYKDFKSVALHIASKTGITLP